MTGQSFAPKPKPVTVDGTATSLVAFYFPGSNTVWDDAYQAPFLGNFWLCSVTLTIGGDSATFKVAEAAFQCTKWWHDASLRNSFAHCADGDAAVSLRDTLLEKGITDDTSYAGLGQIGAMEAVLAAKFTDPALAAGLLATGDAYLLEHSASTRNHEKFWSDHHDGSGGNHLGICLMHLRQKLGGSPNPMPGVTVAKMTALV